MPGPHIGRISHALEDFQHAILRDGAEREDQTALLHSLPEPLIHQGHEAIGTLLSDHVWQPLVPILFDNGVTSNVSTIAIVRPAAATDKTGFAEIGEATIVQINACALQEVTQDRLVIRLIAGHDMLTV